jgi:hypothetical protein
MLIGYALGMALQSGCLPADVGGHPGSVKVARLSSAALTLGCAGTLAAAHLPPGRQRAAGGRRQPFALFTRCQGALENE